jgi:hypothetical protein
VKDAQGMNKTSVRSRGKDELRKAQLLEPAKPLEFTCVNERPNAPIEWISLIEDDLVVNRVANALGFRGRSPNRLLTPTRLVALKWVMQALGSDFVEAGTALAIMRAAGPAARSLQYLKLVSIPLMADRWNITRTQSSLNSAARPTRWSSIGWFCSRSCAAGSPTSR